MSARLCSHLLLALMCLLPPSPKSWAQQAPLDAVNMNRSQMTQWVFAGKVMTLDGHPIDGAKVRVEAVDVSAEVRFLHTDAQGQFYTEYYLGADYVRTLKRFSARLTVTKKGFQDARRSVNFSTENKPRVFPVTLLGVTEDPALLSRAELVSILAPRLKKLGADAVISEAGKRDYASGVEDFFVRKHQERALESFNKVVAADASCVQCRTMLGLVQLGQNDWDGAYDNFAAAVHSILKEQGTGHAEPFIAAGEMEMWQHDPKRAAGYFVEALKFSPDDPLALQELGRSQLLVENWTVARDYLSKSLAAGAGPDAHLMLAAAFLEADQTEAADQQMSEFVAGRNVKTLPLRVRELWARIEKRKEVVAVYARKEFSAAHSPDYLHGSQSELAGLEPATSQLALDPILTAVGKNVEAYFQNFQNTSSLEDIHQEILRGKGEKEKVENSLNQKFRYLCLTPAEATGPVFREYRADLKGSESLPQGVQKGFMLTLGFASSSIVFHPAYQAQAAFRYLGRQKVSGREFEVIAFAQQPAKARMFGEFRMGNTSATILVQGLAWIDSDSHQIVRLHTDLLAPLPQVALKKETTDIQFGEVRFKNAAAGFWLPQEVQVDVDWNGKRLRNKHLYSEFKLFNVQSTEKISNPKQSDVKTDETPSSEKSK